MHPTRVVIIVIAISGAVLSAWLAFGVRATRTNGTHCGAGPPGGNISLQILAPRPNQVITGQALPLHVLAHGFRLNAYYAGTPDLTCLGQYQELLDRQRVDMTPLQHPSRDAISMVGVRPGPHTLTVAPSPNDQNMIMSKAVSVRFYYEGAYRPLPPGYRGRGRPRIVITAPKRGSTVRGASFKMTVRVRNFVLCRRCFGRELIAGEGHWHVYLDEVGSLTLLTMAGGSTQTVPLKGVEPGKHTFWAVLVDNHHMAPLATMPLARVSLVVRR